MSEEYGVYWVYMGVCVCERRTRYTRHVQVSLIRVVIWVVIWAIWVVIWATWVVTWVRLIWVAILVVIEGGERDHTYTDKSAY